MVTQDDKQASKLEVSDKVADEVFDRFVPESTKENYREMARDIAELEGSSPKAALAKLAKGFDDPYLRAWARVESDPGDGSAPGSEAFEIARAVESAKREPKLALQSHPEAVDAAVETVRRGRRRPGAAPVDPDSGVVANTGPAVGVKVPEKSGK